MSRLIISESSESIDQIILDHQSLSPLPNSSHSSSNGKNSKSAAAPPIVSSPVKPRRDHVAAPSMPPTSESGQDERRATMRGQEKDGGISKKSSMTQSDEGSTTSSGNNKTLNGSATGLNGRNDLTDFFSAEVFQIVLHNPTTAHRFLRFCQSRACGENMEFLQKVRVTPVNHWFISPNVAKQVKP